MGNSPSKNATNGSSVTNTHHSSDGTLAVAGDDSDDSSGCSGYIRNQNYQQYYNKRFVKAPLSTSPPKSHNISIPTNAGNASSSTSPLTPSSSLSTPSTVDTMLSSSSSSVDDEVGHHHHHHHHHQQQQQEQQQQQLQQQPQQNSSSNSTPKTTRASVGNNVRKKRGIPVNDFIDRLLNAKSGRDFCLDPVEIKSICRAASSVFMSQPVFLELGTPVKVVGDIHGQYGDLMRIFQTCGMPPKSNYLFLGDYVDRGKQSLETIMLLFCLKIKFPENVFLLRGNHECASVTKVYGFYDECKRRCSVKIWKSIVDVFNTLPIAATIGGKIFCVHGGLSPNLHSMSDITDIQRPTDVPDSGLISDLLWSDPDASVSTWGENDRGVSYCFGKAIMDKFCKKHGFDLIARGHMVVEDGYEFFNNRRLVTVFSAPNYCGEFQNWGAVMSVNKDLLCSFDLLKPLESNNGVKRAVKVVQEAVYKRGSP